MSKSQNLDEVSSMDKAPTPGFKDSLEAVDFINQSEATLPHAPELTDTGVEIIEEKHKSPEEDYIPLADPSTDSTDPICNGELDESQIRRAISAKEKQQRRRRSEAETQLLRQAKIKREMARARRAANDTPNYSTYSLFGSNTDAIVEELKIPIYAVNLVCPSEQDVIEQGVTCFAGQVIMRPRLEAMEYALGEYNERRKIPGRMTLWVDGSLSPKGISGTAVVFRDNPRVVGSKWIVRAYTVQEFDRLGTIHTEALAIMHALRIALAKAIDNDGTSAKASDVVIFSDSMSALHRIKDYTHEGQCWGRSLLDRIIYMANELGKIDVKLQLHWVPAHKGIPGNYLADALAKRAARRELRERRYLSTGRE